MKRASGTRKHLPKIISAYRRGQTLQQLGDTYGVTREWIRQLLEGAGIASTEGGARIKAEMTRVKKRAERDARYLAKRGMTYAEFKAINPHSDWRKNPYRLYRYQVRNAAAREIAWEMNFGQWWRIWQESGHWDERGRGRYVMARFGDTGPYSPGNVHIITAADNTREAMTNCAARGIAWGIHHPNHPLHEKMMRAMW